MHLPYGWPYWKHRIEPDTNWFVQIVTVTPLGVKAEPFPDKEAAGLLAHFGFDDRIPFSVREKTHPYRPFTGSTLYYSQPVVILSNVG